MVLTNEDKEAGFSGDICSARDALVVPANPVVPCSRLVIDPAANQVLYQNNEITDAPAPENVLASIKDPVEKLEGHYVLGGFLRTHFGHFLVECLGMLWALDHAEGPVDGLIFMPYHAAPQYDDRTLEVLNHRGELWMKSIGVDLPVKIVTAPTRVDRITIGEHGFGFGPKFRGSTYFRNFMRSRNALSADDLAKTKRRKLYISRTKLNPRKGGLIGESALERTFVEAGYEPYWPEKETMIEQLATYQTAEAIVAVEGSALHLPPFSCPTDCRFGIVARRSSVDHIETEFGAQIDGFVGTKAFITNRIEHNWGAQGTNNTSMETHSVIDFEATYADLIEAGFLSDSDKLYHPTISDLCTHISESSLGHHSHFHLIGLDRQIDGLRKRAEEARRIRALPPEERQKIAEAERARRHKENYEKVMRERAEKAALPQQNQNAPTQASNEDLSPAALAYRERWKRAKEAQIKAAQEASEREKQSVEMTPAVSPQPDAPLSYEERWKRAKDAQIKAAQEAAAKAAAAGQDT